MIGSRMRDRGSKTLGRSGTGRTWSTVKLNIAVIITARQHEPRKYLVPELLNESVDESESLQFLHQPLVLALAGNSGNKMSRATAEEHATIGYESASVDMSHLEVLGGRCKPQCSRSSLFTSASSFSAHPRGDFWKHCKEKPKPIPGRSKQRITTTGKQ